MKQGTVSIATGIPPVLADRNVHEIVPVVIPFRVREGDGVAGKTETERLRNVQDSFVITVYGCRASAMVATSALTWSGTPVLQSVFLLIKFIISSRRVLQLSWFSRARGNVIPALALMWHGVTM